MPIAHAPHDPFLLDVDGLRALASDDAVRRGLKAFQEHRVLDLGWDAKGLWATVAGSDLDQAWQVDIRTDDAGRLDLDCSCPFVAEPVCKHKISALLAYAARQTADTSQAQSAADAAVEERIQSGRTSVTVEHVAGEPWFGTWTARSLQSTGAALAPYRVQVRSPDERLNTCTCPDFAVNRLGTCKHIEAVLHRVRRQKKRRPQPAVAVVHLEWNVPRAPAVRVRGATVLPEAQRLLDRHFDVGGFLRGTLPDAWYALERDVQALAPDVQQQVSLGEDASAHARRTAEDLARRDRVARVRQEIHQHGSQLPGVSARLFPYQVEGVAFLAGTGRALLADDMGLGKTVQAIAAARWLMDHEGVRRAIVVCPASLKHQWAREIEKFTGLTSVVVEGNAEARERAYRSDAVFVVANYELLMRDQSLLVHECAPDLLIFDEAQRVKNWQTRTAQVVKSIPSRFAFVLSGTPLENRLADLYSVMQLVDARVLGPLWRFELDFYVKDERGKLLGYRNLGELRRRLQGVMLRRQRSVVKDQLPDRLDTRLDVPMSNRQMELHDGALNTARRFAKIAERRPLTPTEEHLLLAALQQARMACNAAGLVDKVTEGSPKLDELARLLDELCVQGGRKVVVFSQWEQMGAMAEGVARKLGIGAVRLHGGVATKNRKHLIDRFHDDPECRVFLSTDAGGVGLNLQCASALINLDLPWNPAILEQRLARVHRLGQKESVLIVLLVAAGSYELRVGALLEGKRHLFGQVIEVDATEETVGLSKGVLALAMKALDAPEGTPPEVLEPAVQDPEFTGDTPEELTVAPPAPEPEPMAPEAEPMAPALERVPVPEPQTEERDAVAVAIDELTRQLGGRVERILIAGGGLLAVLDRVDDEAQSIAEVLSGDVAVAVIDARTHAALQRLGTNSPAAGAREAWLRPEPPAVAPLLTQARRKLQAGDVLIASDCLAEAMPLFAHALLAATAVRAGLDAVPETGAAIWLYGDLVPRGVVSADDAAVLLRAQALAMLADVPVALAMQVRDDARRFVEA